MRELLLRLDPPGWVYVVDDSGLLIAHPDAALMLARHDLSRLPQVRAMLAGGVPVEAGLDLHGQAVLGAAARIAPLGWTVLAKPTPPARLRALLAHLAAASAP
ncbi:MAG: hypothetical protein ACK44A_09435 [Roseateles sp.]